MLNPTARCPRCESPADAREAHRCGQCNEPLAPLGLAVRLEATPRPGEVATIQVRAAAQGGAAVQGVTLSVGRGRQFLNEDLSELRRDLGDVAASRPVERDLALVPKLGGTIALGLSVSLRDAAGNDWVLLGRFSLKVHGAAGAVHYHVGDVVQRASADSSMVLNLGAISEAGGTDWQPLPLLLKEFVRAAPRPIDKGDVLDGRWRVLGVLGQGAFGVVWEAEGLRGVHAGERVAIKTLLPVLATSKRERAAFEREAKTTARLNHENIVRLWAFDVHEQMPYLVMDLAEGPSGDDLLADNPEGLPSDEVTRIGVGLARALAYAHRQEPPVFHRDLKPSNFLLDGRGTPKLADFNLAHEARSRLSRLSNEVSAGTLAYASPEQAMGEPPAPQHDLWALGATLWELCTGEPLFSGPPAAVQLQVLHKEIPPPPGASEALSRVILRCLERDPAKRWGSAEEVARALDGGAEAELAAEREAEERRAERERAERELAAREAAEKAAAEKAAAEEAAAQKAAAQKAAAERAAAAVASPRAFVHEKTGIELIQLPGGTFLMGSPPGHGHPDEHGPSGGQVQVTLSPFAIGKLPVTNQQYRRFVEATGHRAPEYWDDADFNQPQQPVVGVTWHDSVAFCTWAGLALPTEAQWEYAARAGTTTTYWSGDAEDDLLRVGWVAANSGGRLHPAGELPANPWGLHDVHGNVWEWCSDRYGAYPAGPVTDPGGPPSGAQRAYRGGSFWNSPARARSAYRVRLTPTDRRNDLGFRVALSASPQLPQSRDPWSLRVS